MSTPDSSLFASPDPGDHSFSVYLDSGIGEQGDVQTPFKEPQRPPTPPKDPSTARAAMAAALRDGNPEGDTLPREDGAPTRD